MTSTTATTQSRSGNPKPRTLGELRSIPDFDARTAATSVKNEIRRNLLRAIEKGDQLFPGVHGYEDTVIPQIINALLSRHNFILLGLRGQAKSRILRGLAGLLDPEIPVVVECEITTTRSHRSAALAKTRLQPKATRLRSLRCRAISVTLKARDARRDHRGHHRRRRPDSRRTRRTRLSDELTIHYGLLPRATPAFPR